jgi:L-threonylcarbamoyladenylate synthase
LCYGERTPFILEDGECPEGVESTIIGFEENEPIIYRLGAITLEEIESVLGRSVRISNQLKSSKVNSPGMHKKHYSPRTKLKIETMENLKSIKGSNCGFITFSAPIEGNNSVFLGNKGIKEGLQRLYSTLYDLDQMDLDTIYVEQVPEVDSGRTLMDRLRRSAH